MNEEKFLSKNAFDDIIASLEALRTEMQNLVASVDDLNDPGVIADIQSVADQLAEILTVAGISGDITTVAGESANITVIADNITQIQSIVDELQDILAVAAELPAIQTVAGDTAAVNAVAGSIVAVQEVAANIQAVIDAVQAALDAAQARDDAQTWAEGDDPAVELLGGTHSAKTWAEISEQHTREGIRFLGTVDDLENLPPNPNDGDAYFYAETVGDNAIGYGVVWSESEDEWIIFQLGATLIPGTMLPDQEASPAAENQTTFGGFSANPAMSLVMINRIEQESDTYTFDGNQIVFNEGLSAGDIVRVRQWRTQVSFEGLPDVESLSPEDKIPVQTSQGAGVVDPIGILTGVYDSWRVRDLFSQQWSSATTGSATLRRDNSSGLYPMYELLTGDDPDSNGAIATGYRMYYPISANVPNISEMRQVFYFTVMVQGITPETIFRIYNYIVHSEINSPLSNDNFEGAGIEMRDNGELWFQVRPNNGTFQEVRMDYDFIDRAVLRFKIDYNFAQDIIEVYVNNSLVASVAINHTQFSNSLSTHQANIQLLNGSSPTDSRLTMSEAMQIVRVI